MSDLTPETLAELRRLLDAATPGPWSSHDHGFPGQDEPSSIVIYSGERFDWEEVTHGEAAVAWTGWDSQEAIDAALIVAAVNALPALLDAAAERDRLAEAVERVRALHGPRVLQVLGATCFAEECDHEDACPLVDYTVCGHCYDVGDGAHTYAYEEGGLQDVAHPCATYRALDATPETGCES